ncbi:tigger transposable element-derived protein 4-like [Rhizophagus irregularis DAOM 181602=DAOM 197198]|nr:tigger transposable element-derived protein 4-like [Rhizophagus irregularis DAOM 181602=DAOM 197198]
MFPITEEALTVWIDKAFQAGLIFTESILTTKVLLDFALLYNEEKFKASNGWLDNFKKRHNLKQYNIHEEKGSAPIQDLDSMREKLCQTLRDYDPKDIFNCDETGLFWKIKPNRTISNSSVTGTKQSKEHVTFLFTYFYMRAQNRHILLLVDNAPIHTLFENTTLTNIVIEYLSPNTTSHLQPCDQGIINSFKVQYRKLYLCNRVKAFDNFNEHSTELGEINIKKYIKYIARAWDNVMNDTIKNCWLKAGIISEYACIEYGEPSDDESVNREVYENNTDIQLELERLKELEEVQVLINKLDFKDSFTAEEFVLYDDSEVTTEMISDDEILKAVQPNNPKKRRN